MLEEVAQEATIWKKNLRVLIVEAGVGLLLRDLMVPAQTAKITITLTLVKQVLIKERKALKMAQKRTMQVKTQVLIETRVTIAEEVVMEWILIQKVMKLLTTKELCSKKETVHGT